MDSIHQNNIIPPKYAEETETEEDALSFRNFSINPNGSDSINNSPKSTSDPFEFFTNSPKITPHEDELLNEYQKRDYLTLIRSTSSRRSQNQAYGDEINRLYPSNSGRVSGSEGLTPRDCSYHVSKVNITSLTSMSAKSRRRMFMFGMVKFKPEMELSAIKQRQTKRPPAPMFPAVVEKVAAGRGKGGHHWEVVRSLRGRSHLTALLARSFGCIPLN